MEAIKKLRNSVHLQPLFKIRDWIMDKTGMFTIKKKVKYRLFLKRLVREDGRLKTQIQQKIMQLPNGLLEQRFDETDFVLSLTSYGKRVEGSLPYALYSLVSQSVLPKRIVVYLDKDNWNSDKLPTLLQKLQSVGIHFVFWDDIKSFKKLIPALIQYPDNPIITFDDDFYYHPDFLAWMMAAYHNSDKKTVLGQWGCIPEKREEKYIPYNEWKDCKYGDDCSPISFFGCCCCYPPHVFDDEILKKEVFMKLCPKADDIWFWAMEERLGIKRAYITPKGYGYHRPVDRIYEYQVGADGCLTLSNVINGENDLQLRNVLDYYNLD